MGHMGKGVSCVILDRDGGTLGDGVHWQWGTWAIGHMIIMWANGYHG